MNQSQLIALLKRKDCTVRNGKGSHKVAKCGECVSTIPKNLDTNVIHSIRKQLVGCLGDDWLESENKEKGKKKASMNYTLIITGQGPLFCGQLLELPAAITSGYSIAEVQENIIDALASLVGDEEAADSVIVYNPTRSIAANLKTLI